MICLLLPLGLPFVSPSRERSPWMPRLQLFQKKTFIFFPLRLTKPLSVLLCSAVKAKVYKKGNYSLTFNCNYLGVKNQNNPATLLLNQSIIYNVTRRMPCPSVINFSSSVIPKLHKPLVSEGRENESALRFHWNTLPMVVSECARLLKHFRLW